MNNTETGKVWICKYALTEGIYEAEARYCSSVGMIETIEPRMYFNGEGKEWCMFKEDAIKRAEEMRLKKIESHKKSIAKLEKMNFNN